MEPSTILLPLDPIPWFSSVSGGRYMSPNNKVQQTWRPVLQGNFDQDPFVPKLCVTDPAHHHLAKVSTHTGRDDSSGTTIPLRNSIGVPFHQDGSFWTWFSRVRLSQSPCCSLLSLLLFPQSLPMFCPSHHSHKFPYVGPYVPSISHICAIAV